MRPGKAAYGMAAISMKRRARREARCIPDGRFPTMIKPFFQQMKEDFVRYHGLPKRDALYFVQSRLIVDLAKRENFVIMGRHADVILTNAGIPHVNVFICAPFEKRVERISRIYPEHPEKADPQHAEAFGCKAYAQLPVFIPGKSGGRSENYDITINSASYGISGSVALLIGMLEGEIDY